MERNSNAETVIKQVQQTVDNYKWMSQINILPMDVATPSNVDILILRRDGVHPGRGGRARPVMSSGPPVNCHRAIACASFVGSFYGNVNYPVPAVMMLHNTAFL